jgi:predicted kinase
MDRATLTALFAKHASHDQKTHGRRGVAVLRERLKSTPKFYAEPDDPPNLLRGKPDILATDPRPMTGSEAQHRRIRSNQRLQSLTADDTVSFTHQGQLVYGRVKATRGDGTIVIELEDDRGTLTIPPVSSKKLTVKSLLAKHYEHNQKDHNPHKNSGPGERPTPPNKGDYYHPAEWGVANAKHMEELTAWQAADRRFTEEQAQAVAAQRDKNAEVQAFDTDAFIAASMPSVNAAFNSHPSWAVRFRTPERMAQSVANTYKRLWVADDRRFTANDMDELDAYAAVTGHVPAELTQLQAGIAGAKSSMLEHGPDWIQGLIQGPDWQNPMAKSHPEYFIKHTPGGVDHDQKKHGRRGGAAPDSSAPRGRATWETMTPGERQQQIESERPPAQESWSPTLPSELPDVGPAPKLTPPEDSMYWDPEHGRREKPDSSLWGMPSSPLATGTDTPLQVNTFPSSPVGIQAPEGEDPRLVSSVIEESMAKYGARLNLVQEHAGLAQMSYDKDTTIDGVTYPQGPGVDTMADYGNWKGNEFKGWQADRELFHTQIMDMEMARQVDANDGRLPGQDRQAIVMAGLPGAGKTHILKNVMAQDPNIQGFDLRDYVVVNADDLKEHIVAHGNVNDPTDLGLTPGEMSSLVHEESSHVSKQMRRELVAQGTNIALDITAANRDKTLRDIQQLRDQGYTVHVIHADVEVEEAVASALSRAGEGSPEPGKLGRVVPPKFIRSMQHESGTDVVSASFADYAEGANGRVYWYRNWPLSGRRDGRPPQLVWARENIQHQPTLPGQVPAA